MLLSRESDSFDEMTAVEIINEIKQLPTNERTQVVQFVKTLEDRMLTGQQLNELAAKLVEESDSEKARLLKEEIVAGFYGNETAAANQAAAN